MASQSSKAKDDRERIDPQTGAYLSPRNDSNLFLVILMIYWVVMECSRYQGSIGKMCMGVRVINSRGGRVTLANAIGRNLAKFLSIFPLFGVGFLMAACTEKKQAFHDRLAKCFVVRANSWENSWSDETPGDKKFRLEEAEADKDLGWRIAIGSLIAIVLFLAGSAPPFVWRDKLPARMTLPHSGKTRTVLACPHERTGTTGISG